MPRWVYGVGSAVVVVVALFIIMQPKRTADAGTSGIARVSQGSMEVTVTGPGLIRAANAVTVSVPRNVTGELQLIYLYPEGQRVTRGEIVALLDTTSAVEALETALDQLETAEASYEQTLEDLANNIKDLENSVRSSELSYDRAVLQRQNLEFSSELEQQQGDLDVENARISLNEARRKLEAQKIINETDRRQQEISLQARREDVSEARAEIAALTIRAPINGMVIHVEQGRWTERTKVREGDNVRRDQALIQLPDLSELLVEIRINELDHERVRIGQRAVIRLEAYPRVQLPGHVIDVSTLAQETRRGSNVKVFPTVIRIDEADTRARPGMTASVDIVVDLLEDVVQVPLSAIGIVSGRAYVKPVRADSPVEVQLGLRNESMAEVVDGVTVGTLIELGWMQDPCNVLSTLAGKNSIPEEVAWEIIVQGGDYGQGSPIVPANGEAGNPQGGSRTVGSEQGEGRGMRQGIDMTQLTPEMLAEIQARQGSGEMAVGQATGGRGGRSGGEGQQRTFSREGGGGMPDDQRDPERAQRTLEQLQQLQQLRASLPAELQQEIDTLLAGGQVDMMNISTALRDSLRSSMRRSMGGQPGTRPPGGTFMRRAPVDTARITRVRTLFENRLESLPDELRTELERFINRGGEGFTRLSPALRDSFRSWGIFGTCSEPPAGGTGPVQVPTTRPAGGQ